MFKKFRIAVLATAAFAGITTPAIGFYTAPTTLSTETVYNVKKLPWATCWKAMYFQARDDGHSVAGAEALANLTCGERP